MVSSRTGIALVVLVVLSSATSALAQEAAHALTPDEFRSRMEKELPELRQSEADLLMAQAEVEAAGALPNFVLSYEREEAFLGGEAVERKNALAASWMIDFSGRRGHRVASAEHRASAIQQGSEYTKQGILIAAMRVYYLAARARLRAESLQATRTPIAALVETLRNRVNEGDASGYDLARFELHLSEHDDLLSEAATELAVANANLASLLGAGDGSVIAASQLELVAPAPSSLASNGSDRGDMLATKHIEESGRSLSKAASRWWIPSLNLSLGYLQSDVDARSGTGLETAQGYTAMVAASIPVFSRGESERRAGEARIRQAQIHREILSRQVQSQVKSARTRLGALVEQAAKFEGGQLAFAASLVKRTAAAYQGGEASALELGDAYNKSSAAQLRFIELRYRCTLARLSLWSATGHRVEGSTP